MFWGPNFLKIAIDQIVLSARTAASFFKTLKPRVGACSVGQQQSKSIIKVHRIER